MERDIEVKLDPCNRASCTQIITALEAENAELRKDAELYRWLRKAKGLYLRVSNDRWTREDGKPFISTHYLSAYDKQFAPRESLDETIREAMKEKP